MNPSLGMEAPPDLPGISNLVPTGAWQPRSGGSARLLFLLPPGAPKLGPFPRHDVLVCYAVLSLSSLTDLEASARNIAPDMVGWVDEREGRMGPHSSPAPSWRVYSPSPVTRYVLVILIRRVLLPGVILNLATSRVVHKFRRSVS